MGHRIKDEHCRQQRLNKCCQKKKRRNRKTRKNREPSKYCELKRGIKALSETQGLPFQHLLSGELIQQTLDGLGYAYRKRMYCPFITLWVFLSQMISNDKSCEAAVMRAIYDQACEGKRPCSPNTSPYCDARQRLPEQLFWQLARSMGMEVARSALNKWLWKKRHVFLIDGSTITMSDTEANQKEYPQHSNQAEGLGFPTARIAVLFSLATGAAANSQIGPVKGKGTGENELFRQMFDTLQRGDVVLGDCLYDSYRDIAELQRRGVDVVFGMKQSRHADFRTGEKLGFNDHIVTWKRPDFDASRMDRETWERLPKTIKMRELMISVRIRGDVRVIRVVTTLLDASVYSSADILDLFRQRWNVELDIRCLKTVMGMEHLVCKSPSMVRKEFQTYLLAYNLIRVRMVQAAALHNKKPRDLSFNATKIVMSIWLPLIARAPSKKMRDRLERLMLDVIASRCVNKRPERSEPRKRKRRPDAKYPYLTEHRHQEHKRLAA
jgi:hypothetical protein